MSWSSSSDATGYRIDYDSIGGNSSGNVSISAGFTNPLTYTLMNLQNGDTYTLYVVATSSILPSERVPADMSVGLSESNVYFTTMFLMYVYNTCTSVPDSPVINVDSTTATSITISGGVPSDSVADNYNVMWQRDITVECTDMDEGMATSIGEIMNLQEDSTYLITVTAFNSAGSSDTTVTAMTMEAGVREMVTVIKFSLCCLLFFTAPTGLPTSITTTSTRNNITVMWEEVECIHHNGDITGYSLRVMGENDINVTLRETTISGLSPSTIYNVSVAAVNNIGTGPYSDVIMVETLGGIFA